MNKFLRILRKWMRESKDRIVTLELTRDGLQFTVSDLKWRFSYTGTVSLRNIRTVKEEEEAVWQARLAIEYVDEKVKRAEFISAQPEAQPDPNMVREHGFSFINDNIATSDGDSAPISEQVNKD